MAVFFERVNLAILDHLVTEVIPVHRGHPERRVYQDLLARKVPR